MKTDNPYIGPRSFTRDQRDRFFGRSREARNLLSLVISERLVLFYAQSGAGKTSLLNTSLIPSLEDNGRAVLPKGRVSGQLPAGVDAVDNIFIFNLLTHLDQSNTDPACFAHMELKDFLDHLSSTDGESYFYDPAEVDGKEPADDEEALIYVLVIDQFEEILTDHPERWLDRADFFRQLDQAMRHDPGLFVVLTLREDYVAALDPYASLLTERMQSRFYMERMGRKAALEAVTKPAKDYGRPFVPGAAEILVDNLSLVRSAHSGEPQPGQYIEPVQLQVVCYQLWRNLPPLLEEGKNEITEEQVNTIGNINQSLANFYEQALSETIQETKVSELELRNWFKEELITGAGTRGIVFQDKSSTKGMGNRVVRLLENRFLLRAESRSGAIWYELVHDRFVEPILQANQKWLEEQGALLRDALAWLDTNKTDRSLLYTGEKLATILTERAKRSVLEPVITEFLEDCKGRQAWLNEKEAANQKFRRWFKVAVMVAVVAVLTSLWAWQATNKAKVAVEQALTSQKKTKETLNRLQKTEALNIGMALNAKAEAAESKSSRLYAHLYSLHAINKLGKNNKDSEAYMEALIRAQANPVPVPALVGYHTERTNGVAYSPDGRTVASSSNDKIIGIWEVRTGKRLQTLKGHTDGVNSVAFSSDGRLLASGSDDKTIGIWEIQTGKRLQTLEGHTDWIRSVAFSPDSHLLASSSRDKAIGIWNVSTGQRLHTIEVFQAGGAASNISFSPGGQTFAAGCSDGTIGIWDVQTGNRLHTLDGYKSYVLSVAFSPDGSLLAAGSFGTIDLWDVKKGQRLQTIKRDDNWMITGVSFSPDGQKLASGSFGNIISIWDVQTGQYLRMLQGTTSGRNIAFSPDGQTLVSSGSWNNTVGLWETAADKRRYLKGHTGQVQGISFSADGRTVTSVSKDKTIGIWDVATGRRLKKVPLQAMKGSVNSIAISPDGRILALTSQSNNSINLLEFPTGKHLQILEGHTNNVDSVVFSHDSRTLASVASSSSSEDDSNILLWDVKTGKRLRALTETGFGSSLSFSPDGNILAFSLLFGNNSININFWDVSTGHHLQSLKETDGSNSVPFSPDGRLVAFDDDNTIAIWDVKNGKRVQTLKGHTASVNMLSFSSDGLLLASSSMDKTIAIWDVKSGKRVRILKGGISSDGIISFSPDSRHLAFTTNDNAIGLWDLELTVNEFSGISLDKNGEYQIDLDTLPYKLEGLELKPIEQKQTGPAKPAQWSRYHPFHWLPAAEKGNSNAMLQIGIIYDRNNDIARALRWYGKAIKAGSKQAKKQQDILLHWLKDEENRKTVPGPFMQSLCAAQAEFNLPKESLIFCDLNSKKPAEQAGE